MTRIVFRLKRGKDSPVYLAGDFNNWDPMSLRMSYETQSECHVLALDLPPGRYEYKFFVDGIWEADPENSCTTANRFGTVNSVIEIV